MESAVRDDRPVWQQQEQQQQQKQQKQKIKLDNLCDWNGFAQ